MTGPARSPTSPPRPGASETLLVSVGATACVDQLFHRLVKTPTSVSCIALVPSYAAYVIKEWPIELFDGARYNLVSDASTADAVEALVGVPEFVTGHLHACSFAGWLEDTPAPGLCDGMRRYATQITLGYVVCEPRVLI
jgi:hypothetical protein